MPLIVPYFAESQTAAITIDGITYRVPLIDSDGHLQVDVLTTPLEDALASATTIDPMHVNAFRPGASEVAAVEVVTVSDSSVRVNVVTPTSGKKIRIVSCQITSANATAARFEVYFGTGANIGTNAGKEVLDARLDADHTPNFGMSWPDGAGPVGAVDDVLSLRTHVDIAATGRVVVQYREE